MRDVVDDNVAVTIVQGLASAAGVPLDTERAAALRPVWVALQDADRRLSRYDMSRYGPVGLPWSGTGDGG